MCAVRCGEIRSNGVGAATGFLDLGDNGLGFLRAVAVVDQDLRTHPGESQGAGTADAARGAGDESGLSRKLGHCQASFIGEVSAAPAPSCPARNNDT